MERVYSEIDM